jgi:acyl-CoA hydrolase
MYADINGYGRLFGGRLMEWIDEVAGLAAVRHCRHMVTTAAVDNLQFKRAATLGEIVVLIAKVTYVGHTSVEVRVDTYVEDVESGVRRPINRAYLTEVCIDENGRPVPVEYGLTPETPGEEAEYEGAKRRIALRKTRRQEGY